MTGNIPEDDRHKRWNGKGDCDCGGFGTRYYNQWHRDNVAKSRISRIVFEDMDLIIRNTDTDAFALAEFKFGTGGDRDGMNYAQMKTFKDIDEVLKNSSLRDRYKGFFYVWSSVNSFEESEEIYINNKPVDLNQLRDFYHLKQEVLDMIPKHDFSIFTLRSSN